MFNFKKIIGLVCVLGISAAFSVSSFAYVGIDLRTGNLSATYKTDVREARNIINGYAPLLVRFVESTSNTPIAPATDKMVVVTFVDKSFYGTWVKICASAINGDIHINKDEVTTSAQRIKVLKHEMGHVMGLPHSTDKNSIMFPYLDEITGVGIFVTSDLNILKNKYAASSSNSRIGNFLDVSTTCSTGITWRRS